MVAPKRPKKAMIQFAVAAIAAVVLGGISLVIVFFLVTGITGEMARKEAEQKKIAEENQRKLEEMQAQLEAAKNPANQVPEKFKEVQAAVEIGIGEPITEAMLTEAEAEGRPNPDAFFRKAQVIGKVAGVNFLPGQPITRKGLLKTEDSLPVAKGMRAVSINVSTTGMVSGAVQPGSRIDIMAILPNGDNKMTRVLLQDIRVMLVGDVGGGGGKGGMPITVEVTPKQAELLALANSESSFHLALRGFGDKEKVDTIGADMGQLISGISPEDINAPGAAGPPVMTAPNVVGPPLGENLGGLPAPGVPEPSAQSFKMEIYRGAGEPEVKEFEWEY